MGLLGRFHSVKTLAMPQPMFPWLRPPKPHGKSVACLSSGWVEVEGKVMSFGHEALRWGHGPLSG